MAFFKSLLKRKLFWFLAIVAVVGAGYWYYRSSSSDSGVVSYVTAQAAIETVSSTVSGSGQISSSNQVDIKPSASGTVVAVNVKEGQNVVQGQLLIALDSRSAQRTVDDARTALETAKLNLEKIQEPVDALTLLQSQNALITAQNQLAQAQADLTKAYDDGFTAVSNAFLNLPTLMTGLRDLLMSNTASANQWNLDFYSDAARTYDLNASQYRDSAYNAYLTARSDYDRNFTDYKNTSRSSGHATIVALISETYDTTRAIAEAIKDANNLIQFYSDTLTTHNAQPIALATTHLNQLNGFTNTANSTLSSLLNIKQSIDNDASSIESSNRTIAERQASLAKLQEPVDALDLRSAQITVEQRRNALTDAQQKLSDYFVRAPFAGLVAAVDARVGDTAGGAAVATLISKQQVADVSLNEVDSVKVIVGQKATISFDAIDGLEITGQVSQLDLIGTVSQGVVSYNAKVVFDTQDDRIKSGMSCTVTIITDTKVDAIAVPSSAVRTQGNASYVQIMKDGAPVRTEVTTGISSDTMTEIVSGLNEGDEVVTQTVTGPAKSSSANANSSRSNAGFGIPGIGGGDAIRIRAPGN
jgi:RND family efflux transporter MFP subunit